MRSPATSPVPIAERIAAVANAGFTGLGLIADDLRAVREAHGFRGLRDMIADSGLNHVEIELIERWWIPRGEPGDSYDVRELLFEAADVLAPAFIKIGSELGPPTTQPETLVEPLQQLADEAQAHGTRIAIETMPFSIISTVPMGAELDDADPEVIGTLFEDTVERRQLCGAGAFDLHSLVTVLRELGFDGPWGVEILSESFRKLPVGEALKLAAESALTVLSPA